MNFAPFSVHHNTYSESFHFIQPPNPLDHRPVPLTRAVAHVETRDVHATRGKRFEIVEAAFWRDLSCTRASSSASSSARSPSAPPPSPHLHASRRNPPSSAEEPPVQEIPVEVVDFRILYSRNERMILSCD